MQIRIGPASARLSSATSSDEHYRESEPFCGRLSRARRLGGGGVAVAAGKICTRGGAAGSAGPIAASCCASGGSVQIHGNAARHDDRRVVEEIQIARDAENHGQRDEKDQER